MSGITGSPAEVDGEGSLSKSVFTIDADNRVTTVTKNYDASNTDAWTFNYAWPGDQKSYTDGDSKQTQNVRDDLEFHLADHMDQVISLALLESPRPSPAYAGTSPPPA